MPDNSVTLIGNATRDPELRFTTGGRGIASFGLAVNRRWQQNGEWQEEASFFNITCWGDLGENVSASVKKGSRVIVTGRLQQRSWETQDGEKRSVVEVNADDVGASMKWAQVEIERNERYQGGDGGQRQSSGSSGSSGGGGSQRQPDPVYGDEEPF